MSSICFEFDFKRTGTQHQHAMTSHDRMCTLCNIHTHHTLRILVFRSGTVKNAGFFVYYLVVPSIPCLCKIFVLFCLFRFVGWFPRSRVSRVPASAACLLVSVRSVAVCWAWGSLVASGRVCLLAASVQVCVCGCGSACLLASTFGCVVSSFRLGKVVVHRFCFLWSEV